MRGVQGLRGVRAPRLLALASLFTVRVAFGADCNGNGTPDIEEIRSGALPDCNANGIPDVCDIEPVNYGLLSSGSVFVGSQPSDLVIDDMDADGDADMAAGSGESGDVILLWNDGKGRFASPARWRTEQSATRLIPADLDGDGRKDLAIGGNFGLSVLFQTSERGFVRRVPLVNLDAIGPLVGSDLDGDSDFDLAAAVSFGVHVLRNEGTGAFTPLDRMTTGSLSLALAAVNLDGDADLDLVTANATAIPLDTGNVSVLINKGDASFDTARNYATGPHPFAMASGDLDGDGDADLATTSASETQLTILAGNGQGRFTRLRQIETGKRLQALISVDIDADGDLDFAVTGSRDTAFPGRIAVLLNHGRAEFTLAMEFEIGFASSMIRSADIDSDRSLDLVLGDVDLDTVLVLQGSRVAYATDCNSNLLPDECELEGNDCNRNDLPDECDIASLESADCDQDGMPDECQPDCNGNAIADVCDIASGFAADCNRNGAPDDCDIQNLRLGFETSSLKLEAFPRLLAASDLDGDGLDDLYALAAPQDLLVFWNGEDEGFLPERRFPAGAIAFFSAVGDFDGDSDRDIVLSDILVGGLQLLENRGNRTFAEGTKLPVVPMGAHMVSSADLDGDLDPDLAMTTSDFQLAVMENRGGGAFERPLLIAGPVTGRVLWAVDDFDGDGRPDIAADNLNQDAILIFWNEGSFAFSGPTTLGPRFSVQGMAVVDADKDGDRDIYLSMNRLLLFRKSGGRVFTLDDSVPNPVSNALIRGLLPGDLDLDGDQDLVGVPLSNDRRLVALINRGDGAFDIPVSIPGVIKGFDVLPSSGDWNADGAMDLAMIPPPPLDGPQLLVLINLSRPTLSPDADRNGVPDECQQRAFRRGDANGDGQVDLTDPVFTLGHLFRGEPAPACLEAADTNNDARLEITDPIATLEFLFRGGTPPAPPGPPPAPCGLDTDASGSAGDIGCGAYTGC